MIKNALFCSCKHNFHTKQFVERHIVFLFLSFDKSFGHFGQKQTSLRNVYIFYSQMYKVVVNRICPSGREEVKHVKVYRRTDDGHIDSI